MHSTQPGPEGLTSLIWSRWRHDLAIEQDSDEIPKPAAPLARASLISDGRSDHLSLPRRVGAGSRAGDRGGQTGIVQRRLEVGLLEMQVRAEGAVVVQPGEERAAERIT